MIEPFMDRHPLPWEVNYITDPAYVNDRCYELLDANGDMILSGYEPDLLYFIAGTSCHFRILEKLVQQVREIGLATGHADTPEELMAEVLEQVERLRGLLAGAMNALAGYGPGGKPLSPEDRERLSAGARDILKSTEGE